MGCPANDPTINVCHGCCPYCPLRLTNPRPYPYYPRPYYPYSYYPLPYYPSTFSSWPISPHSPVPYLVIKYYMVDKTGNVSPVLTSGNTY